MDTHLNNPELDALAAETKAADAPAETAAPGTLIAPRSPAREWAEIPAMVGAGLVLPMPELAPVYSDAACLQWGEAMVPVADKYGWTPAKIWPEIRLLMATGAFLIPTVQAFRARIAAAQQQAAQQPENPTKQEMPAS